MGKLDQKIDNILIKLYSLFDVKWLFYNTIASPIAAKMPGVPPK